MYSHLKNILLSVFPKKTLFRYEYSLRFFYYLFYAGSSYRCSICEKNFRKFVSAHNDKICPRCGSLSRARRLWTLIESEFLFPNISILDFSPSRTLYRFFKKTKYNYISSDLSGDFIADVSYDITQIDCADEKFSLIICYHILEHIEDDIKAMKELYRILSKNGVCIIQTPFKEGEIYEDLSIQSEKERALHFGQKDHVRIYSVNALNDRLTNVGFQVEIREFKAEAKNQFGFQENEKILVCRKK